MEIYDVNGDGEFSNEEIYMMVSVEVAFAKYDVDGSGEIDENEFRLLLSEIGFADMSADDVRDAMYELDSDGSGLIEKAEVMGKHVQYTIRGNMCVYMCVSFLSSI